MLNQNNNHDTVINSRNATNRQKIKIVHTTSDILVLKLISVLVFILFSSQNFYFISF